MALAQVSKNKVVNYMALMDKWLNKMVEEVSDAKRVTKTVIISKREKAEAARKKERKTAANLL